ncbi:hypothetical protein GGH92_006508 [Coemansia sp. RSA 2673]|nr:hypothetical protein GGH92_006508 [Coemansia sp. RSA 2673]
MRCLQAGLCRRAAFAQRLLLTRRRLVRDFTIAIDGPAASGKSSTARAVAHELGFGYIDSGSIYRCATLLALRAGIADVDERASDLIDMITRASVDIKVHPGSTRPSLNLITGRLAVPAVQVLLNSEDVSEEIRKPEVNRLVAKVASDGGVRAAVLGIQRSLAAAAETKPMQVQGRDGAVKSVPGGVVMDGRDIGTTIFPNAELKIYLDASAMARAIRRWDEMNSRPKDKQASGGKSASDNTAGAAAAAERPNQPAVEHHPSVEDIARELEARDYADINRQNSPLRIAPDAVVIDNTTLTFEQQVYTIADLARDRMGLERQHDDM